VARAAAPRAEGSGERQGKQTPTPSVPLAPLAGESWRSAYIRMVLDRSRVVITRDELTSSAWRFFFHSDMCARPALPPCCPAQGEAARPASLVEAGRGAGLCRRTQADIRERSLDSSAVLRCAEPSRCSRAGPRRYLFHATPNGNAARPGPVPTVTFNENGSFMSTLEGAPSRRTRLQWELLMKDYDECVRSRRPTRPPLVLSGHAASLTPY